MRRGSIVLVNRAGLFSFDRRWGQLVAPLRRLLDGERDEDALTNALDFKDWLIVATVLRAVADPAALAGVQAVTHAIAAAALQSELRPQLDEAWREMRQHGWGNLVDAACRLLDGERDADTLCAGLDAEGTIIISTALAAIVDPELLQALAAKPPPR